MHSYNSLNLASMLGIAVQGALATSLFAASGPALVSDQSTAPLIEPGELLDGQRWAFEEPTITLVSVPEGSGLSVGEISWYSMESLRTNSSNPRCAKKSKNKP